MEALKAGNLTQLSDYLSEMGDELEVNMEYEAESFKTLLQVTYFFRFSFVVLVHFSQTLKLHLKNSVELLKSSDDCTSKS
jgi:hypothetical protein